MHKKFVARGKILISPGASKILGLALNVYGLWIAKMHMAVYQSQSIKSNKDK
jgi:hypothetical protein